MIQAIRPQVALFARPTSAAVTPAPEALDSFQPSQAPPPLPWPEMEQAGLLAATSSLPGPVGALLSQAARDGLLDFFQRMEATGARMHTLRAGPPDRSRLQGDLTPEEATARVLAGGATFQEPLYVRDPATWGLYPLSNCQDLQLLDTMFGAGARAGGPQPELAALLRDLTQEHGFRVDSDKAEWCFSHEDSTLVYSGSRPMAAYRSILGLETNPTELVPPDVWNGFPVQELDKILVLDYFLGTGQDRGLKQPELAGQLQAIDRAGFQFDRYPFASHGLTDAQGAVWTYLGLEAEPATESLWLHRPDKAYFPVHPADLGDLEKITRRADTMDELMQAFEPRTAALGLSRRFPVFTWLSFEHYPQLPPEVVFDAGIQALEAIAARGQQPPILELREALVELAPHLKTEEALRDACQLLAHALKDESLSDRGRLLIECKQNGADYLTQARERFGFLTPGVGGNVAQQGDRLTVGGVRLPIQRRQTTREPHP